MTTTPDDRTRLEALREACAQVADDFADQLTREGELGDLAVSLVAERIRALALARLAPATAAVESHCRVCGSRAHDTGNPFPAPPAAGSREGTKWSIYCDNWIQDANGWVAQCATPEIAQRIVAAMNTPEATASAAGGARVAELEAALRKIRDEVDHVGKDHGFTYCNEIARAALALPPPGVDRPEAS